MKLNPMVDMALDDEEVSEVAMPIPDDPPKYPPGLRICLTQDELQKLQLDPTEAMQGIGGLVHLHALARITSASIDQRNDIDKDGDETRVRIELQIENLAIESEDEENAEMDAQMPRKKLAYAAT